MCLQLSLICKSRSCNSRNVAANSAWQSLVVQAVVSRLVLSVSARDASSFLY
jgi:hypothetical protein